MVNNTTMNIFELTRILNEMNNVSEPAKKTIDVVKMFDTSVESSGDSKEIVKKDRFLGKVTNIIFAGLGGQGVLKASDILAEILFSLDYDVKKSEVHGIRRTLL